MNSAHAAGGPASPPHQLPRVRLLVMLLAGPALIVAAGVLWAADAPDAVVGVLQVAGFALSAVLTAWVAAVVLLALPLRVSQFALPGAVALFIVSAVLHNVWYAVAGTEEPVFFLLALIVAPAVLLGALFALASRTHWTRLPATRPGWAALALVVAFAAFMLLFFGGVAAGQRGGETFFSNPYLAITILLAAASAILAGLAAGFALLARGERSLSAILIVALGIFVAFFAVGEALGHDEPRGDGSEGRAPPGANSHTNLSATAVSANEVRVSFDYSYAGDPPDARITSLTITPVGAGGTPLPGYVPWTTPVARGSGHVDTVVQFVTGQLDAVTGFSVCFAGPGNPDLGCAAVNY